jgi:gliding motility-associated-like protein
MLFDRKNKKYKIVISVLKIWHEISCIFMGWGRCTQTKIALTQITMKVKLFYIFWIVILSVGQVVSQSNLPVCTDATAPIISTEKPTSCVGQAVTLKAAGCDGTVTWSNKISGVSQTVFPKTTTTYTAVCNKTTCKSATSNVLTVDVVQVRTPIVNTNKKTIVIGESATLTATGCTDKTMWSNGMTGNEIVVSPILTTKYTATCRANGCLSCFATEVEVKVVQLEQLLLGASKSSVCVGDSATLTAKGTCKGQIVWSNGMPGREIIVSPTTTTTYSAVCKSDSGVAVETVITIETGLPAIPQIKASKSTICYTESTTLTATNCDGTVVWSDGQTGSNILVKNDQGLAQTLIYSAICKRNACESQRSTEISLNLIQKVATPNSTFQLINVCPYQTVDLSTAILTKPSTAGGYFVFSSSDKYQPLTDNTGTIAKMGTYYFAELTPSGCMSALIPIKVTLADCINGIAPCSTNPATALILKTEQTTANNYYLEGKIGGSASKSKWATSGTGTFSNVSGLTTVYSPSATDRKAGKITISLKTNDPDSTGPCQAASAIAEIKIDSIVSQMKELLGVSKYLNSNGVFQNPDGSIVPKRYNVEYYIKLFNLGNHDLIETQILDSLDKVFKNGSIIVGKPIVTVLNNTNSAYQWAIDTSYTGQNGHYEILRAEKCILLKGESRTVSIKMVVDLSKSRDTLFLNTAYASSLDVDGNICKDVSTDGKLADPDGNGDPLDNSTPTPFDLKGYGGGEIGDVFIPEGFSPNDDGLNDLFVIKKPNTLTMTLEIYNRNGGLVYSQDNYKNDWNGSSNVASNQKMGLPDGTYFYVVKLSDGREFSRFMTIIR